MLYYNYFNNRSDYDKLPECFDWEAARIGTIVFAKMIDASGQARPSVMKWVKANKNIWHNLGDNGPIDQRNLTDSNIRIARELLSGAYDWRILNIMEPTICQKVENTGDNTNESPLIVRRHTGSVTDEDALIAYTITPVVVENLTAGRATFGLHIRVSHSNESNVIKNIVVSVIDCTAYVYDIREDTNGTLVLVQTHIVPIMQIRERNELVGESKQKTMYDRVCERLACIVIPHIGTSTKLAGKIASDSLYVLFEHIAFDSLWLAGQDDDPGISGIIYLLALDNCEMYLQGIRNIEFDDSKLSNYRKVVHASESPLAYVCQDGTKLENYKVSEVVIVSEQNQEVRIMTAKE